MNQLTYEVKDDPGISPLSYASHDLADKVSYRSMAIRGHYSDSVDASLFIWTSSAPPEHRDPDHCCYGNDRDHDDEGEEHARSARGCY